MNREASRPYRLETIEALKASLSGPHFRKYLTKAGFDEALALKLYAYNAELAGAFLFPLGVAEIALRNAVDRSLVNVYGLRWHVRSEFRKILSPMSRELLAEHVRKSRFSSTGKVARAPETMSDRHEVISRLHFGFWTRLVHEQYEAQIWRTELKNGELYAILPMNPQSPDSSQKTRPGRSLFPALPVFNFFLAAGYKSS